MDNKGDRLGISPPLPPAVDALLKATTTLIPSTPSPFLLPLPPDSPRRNKG